MEHSYSIILPIPKLVKYEDISLDNYYNYFTNEAQTGGSISDIILYHKDLRTNNYLRRGGGFWSFFGNLVKKSLPFILPEAINIGQSLLKKQQTKGKISKKDLSDISKDSIKRVVKKVISGSRIKTKKCKNINRKSNKKIKKRVKRKINRKKRRKNKHFDHLNNNIFSSV